MAHHRLGIVMHGVTGRMGLNQHLTRSILAIRANGGVRLASGDTVMPDPLLLGRNAQKLDQISRDTGIDAVTTDYDAAIGSADHSVFFDAGSTLRRPELLTRAIAAGKHIYCEKPVGIVSRVVREGRGPGRASRGEVWRRDGQALLAWPDQNSAAAR